MCSVLSSLSSSCRYNRCCFVSQFCSPTGGDLAEVNNVWTARYHCWNTSYNSFFTSFLSLYFFLHCFSCTCPTSSVHLRPLPFSLLLLFSKKVIAINCLDAPEPPLYRALPGRMRSKNRGAFVPRFTHKELALRKLEVDLQIHFGCIVTFIVRMFQYSCWLHHQGFCRCLISKAYGRPLCWPAIEFVLTKNVRCFIFILFGIILK